MPIAGILCEYPIACEIEAAILVPVKLAVFKLFGGVIGGVIGGVELNKIEYLFIFLL